ncbi:hypothetical protein CEXT_281521 [Caerostris extrusa]|uniref:Uncharacterized protein n=1 Tax=Caerostris extrusa TaxID=172846 RepID=A0AAV4VXX6_CAEEX|nr:hypothetical protein CEXT_281521 [Caerostris extrusa]
MAASASLIPEASAEVASTALIMTDHSEKATFTRQRFIILVEKEVSLTVWKNYSNKKNLYFWNYGCYPHLHHYAVQHFEYH